MGSGDAAVAEAGTGPGLRMNQAVPLQDTLLFFLVGGVGSQRPSRVQSPWAHLARTYALGPGEGETTGSSQRELQVLRAACVVCPFLEAEVD